MLRKTLATTLLLAASGLASAATLDTTAAWDGSSYLQPFGFPHTSTYGQVVKAAGSQLDAFSFLVNLPDALTFKAYVYAWDGAKATGSALYTSAVTSDNGAGYNTVSFNTGGTALNSGQDYVLFFSISELYAANAQASYGNFATVAANTYTDGDMYWFNNEDRFADLTSQSWEKWIAGDFAFTARFSDGNTQDVAEPAALALLGLGMLGLAWNRRRPQA